MVLIVVIRVIKEREGKVDKPLSKMTVGELRTERNSLTDTINAVLAGATVGDEAHLNHSLMLVVGELLDRGVGWAKAP